MTLRIAGTLLAGTVLAGCSTTGPTTDAPPEARTVSASGWVATSDDVRIRYHQAGAGEPALVFVHGWLCDSRYWRLQVPAFSDRFRVITLDLAGHGESGFGREQWTIQAFARDVVAVIEASGAARVVLVGHSLGGPVVIEAARLLGDRVLGVVGVDTLRSSLFDPLPREQRRVALAPYHADFAGATRQFVASGMFASTSEPSLKEWIVADMAEGPPVVGLGALEGLLDYNPATGLGALEVPFVLINSDYAPTDTSRIAAVTRDARFETVHGVGHFLMLEAPTEFNTLLEQAISSFMVAAEP